MPSFEQDPTLNFLGTSVFRFSQHNTIHDQNLDRRIRESSLDLAGLCLKCIQILNFRILSRFITDSVQEPGKDRCQRFIQMLAGFCLGSVQHLSTVRSKHPFVYQC